MDQITEVTREGWFSRIVGSFKSVLVGLLLFFVSFPLLWWNEGRAVQTARSLDEGAGAVVTVQADKIDPAQQGKLVHLAGLAQTTETLRDEDFGVAQPAIKLVRSVEMYQWVEAKKTETEKKLGGSEEKKTVYRYEKQWSATRQDSSQFKEPNGHSNPALKVEPRTWVAQNVTVGAFTLPRAMVDGIGPATPLALGQQDLAKLTPEFQALARVSGGAIILRPGAQSASFDPTSPEIGDHRVGFSVVPAAEVSLVAKQSGSSFEPYQTKAGDPISLIRPGKLTAEAMFQSAEAANQTLTWIARAVGFLCMLFGVGMVFRPLVVVADVVPLIGSLLGLGTFLVALGVALPLSTLTIAVAWLMVRPLLGGALLAGAVLVLGGVIALGRKRKAARAAKAAKAETARP
jgi:hypothetical protein